MTTPFEGSKTVWVLTQKGTGSVAFVMVPKILDGRDKFESELNEAVAWRTLNKANLGVLGDGEFTRLTANVHDLYVRGFYSFNFERPRGGKEACWHLLENI